MVLNRRTRHNHLDTHTHKIDKTMIFEHLVCCCCCLVSRLCPILCNPVDCSMPGFTVLHYLPEFAQIHYWVGDAVEPFHSLLLSSLLCLQFFPSIRVFSNELALFIRWPKYWSFSFIISLSNECSGLISFRIDWFDLAVQGTLKSLLQHHNSKHQFFSTQLSLQSNSHIHTWLLVKPRLGSMKGI